MCTAQAGCGMWTVLEVLPSAMTSTAQVYRTSAGFSPVGLNPSRQGMWAGGRRKNTENPNLVAIALKRIERVGERENEREL